MIDKEKGVIKINDQLEISSKYTFEEFKRTKYYKGQDGIRAIYLDGTQIIDGGKYVVGLFFKEGTIYMVSLVNCEKELSEEDESERKIIHDEILLKKGVEVGKQYSWGKVTSEYDARGNVSSINVYFVK